MKILSAQELTARYATRNHLKPTGTVDIAASAETGGRQPEDAFGDKLDTVQAMAVKGFAQISGPLQFVKAKEHFYVAGEPVYVGDFVQVTVEDAKRLSNAGRADLATEDEVKAAQTPQKASK